jgi:hypothetical protein
MFLVLEGVSVQPAQIVYCLTASNDLLYVHRDQLKHRMHRRTPLIFRTQLTHAVSVIEGQLSSHCYCCKPVTQLAGSADLG